MTSAFGVDHGEISKAAGKVMLQGMYSGRKAGALRIKSDAPGNESALKDMAQAMKPYHKKTDTKRPMAGTMDMRRITNNYDKHSGRGRGAV